MLHRRHVATLLLATFVAFRISCAENVEGSGSAEDSDGSRVQVQQEPNIGAKVAAEIDVNEPSLDPVERKKRQISRQDYLDFLNGMQDPRIDPRAAEGWWMLYPYGKYRYDNQLMGDNGRETQANLGFPCPYFGYRFNYTMVYPGGFISFAQPPFMQPPFDFPNPLWPRLRDHGFIAPFYADSTFQWVGNVRISNVWFRSIHRPTPAAMGFIPENEQYGNMQSPVMGEQYNPNQGFNQNQFGAYGGTGGAGFNQLPNPQTQSAVNPNPFELSGVFSSARATGRGGSRVKRQMPSTFNQVGMTIDPALLDNITRDVQEGYNGANGWRAEHAFIVTWERMAYGGAPKAVDVSQFNQVRQWQNTFQLVIASDEIRTFAIFNYARLNWTTSTEAGGLNGFGGKQAAMVGFNGGNGTGFSPMPYSGTGRNWMLGTFSNVLQPGRWIYRIDEVITPAGCSNKSVGDVVTAPPWGPMQGGIAVNVSGPCLRQGDSIKVTFENWEVDCRRVNRIRAQCIMPIFHRTGLIKLGFSRDGVSPELAPSRVKLLDDVNSKKNRWYGYEAKKLVMTWQARNLTHTLNSQVDVALYGYWEDADRSHFEMIDYLAESQTNSGRYEFDPRQLQRRPRIEDAWRKYQFGFVRVSIRELSAAEEKHGVQWSRPTPFAWYYKPTWEYEYGQNWALDMCIEWFEYDGRRRNFQMELVAQIPCPCKLEQALLDLGRFMPVWQCDMDGNQACPFNKGAQHCVQSVAASPIGSSQQCCYNYQGFLMFSDDWEPTGDYLRYFNPGTPARAHAFGSHPFRLPPRVPYLSHYQLDLVPYRVCCNYAKHCEFYYWRRQTNGCQDYRPSGAASMYGLSHVVSFDGLRYSFPGKGYFVAMMSDDPLHTLMVQVRMEQPPDTLWHSQVNATVITGVAIKENDSDVVEVYARKPMRRWRYKTDVYVGGVRRFFDMAHWHYQQFNGLSVRVPQRNMNQSEIVVMLWSGAGVKITESYGYLNVEVFLPQAFNTSCTASEATSQSQSTVRYGRRCYITQGIMGTWNNRRDDEIWGNRGSGGGGAYTDRGIIDENQLSGVYQTLLSWRVDGTDLHIGPLLFGDYFRPIYNPLRFADPIYYPQFIVNRVPDNATLIFDMEEVVSTCAGDPFCKYDYVMTGRREVATNTLKYENGFMRQQRQGSKRLTSCGPLLKKEGVIKTPMADNYLDGSVVTFSCKPDFFAHGDTVRYCVNGTWSPGWWVWCRDRNLEYALKWLTAILVSLTIIFCCTCIFCCCWRRRVRLEQEGYIRPKERPQVQNGRNAPPLSTKVPLSNGSQSNPSQNGHMTTLHHDTPLSPTHGEPPPPFSMHDTSNNHENNFDYEPRRVGLASGGGASDMNDHDGRMPVMMMSSA